MSSDVTQIDIPVPDDLTPSERRELADLIIEHIVDRTQRGIGKNGEKWTGKRGNYSDEYMNSLDFKATGKEKKVNLELSGDMLAALRLINTSPGNIRIGYKKGSSEEKKAEGNILGTYGQDKPIPGKARDFLGIERSKLRELLDYVKGEK